LSSPRTTRRTIILAAAVVLVVGIIAGVAIYRDLVKPFRTIVLEVDGRSFGMRYFLKRAAMAGGQPMNMLQALTEEEILRQTAPKAPYNLTATEQEIDQYARNVARGSDQSIGDAEFREWYRQQLNESQLTEAEYREMLRAQVLALKMSAYLAERVPTVAEQVLLNIIAVKNSVVGAEVKKRLDAGESFASLVREYSIDPSSKANGGRVGWFPRGVLTSAVDAAAFDLPVGQSSDPVYLDEQTVVLVMVSQKAAARRIDEQSLEVLKSRALNDWFQAEYPKHAIRLRGFHNAYDSETDAWVQRQLMKMRPQPASASSSSG
jgi:parvulin-like peptidyl-prolyl isomerase